MKILIIDDEQLDLFINKKLLSLEFDVEGFTNVDDALAWATANTFDVALIDFYLGTGLYANDVMLKLLSLKSNPFKAFVLSNYVDEQQIKEIKIAGFKDILYKPLTLEKFKSLLL
jgi:DNA-binding NarL/FixJ family response regulator